MSIISIYIIDFLKSLSPTTILQMSIEMANELGDGSVVETLFGKNPADHPVAGILLNYIMQIQRVNSIPELESKLRIQALAVRFSFSSLSFQINQNLTIYKIYTVFL